jgi:hypothetical protein
VAPASLLARRSQRREGEKGGAAGLEARRARAGGGAGRGRHGPGRRRKKAGKKKRREEKKRRKENGKREKKEEKKKRNRKRKRNRKMGKKIWKSFRKIRRLSREGKVFAAFFGFSGVGVIFGTAVMARGTGRRDRYGAGVPSWWPTAALGRHAWVMA